MERRRLMFMGLAGALTATLGLAATTRAGILGDTTGLSRGPMPSTEDEAFAARQAEETEAEGPDGGVQLAQYQRSGRYRRGPRCWNETRNVRYRDGRGRVHVRTVQRRVCR
jgi:hypothetical protein